MSEVAVFGGGCFWCTEAVFQRLKGVVKVVSGYAGGKIPNPSYDRVSVGTTGHAEVVEITFQPDQISYQQLLQVFFVVHDPTTLNQQGYDKGTQYRSVIFTTSTEQAQQANKYITELTEQREFENPIVTEVVPLDQFFTAEEYHQNYYNNNQAQPYCQLVINPKLDKLFKQFPELLASQSK
jgi:peptide-methionine (S)-S-oxide reductase